MADFGPRAHRSRFTRSRRTRLVLRTGEGEKGERDGEKGKVRGEGELSLSLPLSLPPSLPPSLPLSLSLSPSLPLSLLVRLPSSPPPSQPNSGADGAGPSRPCADDGDGAPEEGGEGERHEELGQRHSVAPRPLLGVGCIYTQAHVRISKCTQL